MARRTPGVVIPSRLNLARRAISVLLMALMSEGCGEAPTHIVTDYCTPWRAIYTSKQDVLTDGTAKAIFDHDRTGAKLCGWKPNPPKEK